MTHESDSGLSRRKFVAAAGTGIAGTALAGCIGGGDGSGSDGPGTLTSGGSSTVYPIMNTAASYWQGNRPASDTEYWPHGEYNINTDKNLADYWAGLYGFEAGSEGQPPFPFTVGLSHSGTGVEKVKNGQYDIGNSSGNVEDELPERDSYEKFIDHVVGVDGQPLVVSQEIADAGLSKITGQQLKDLYKGRISTWSEIDSSLPDRDVQVLGRVKGSGTRTSFVSNVFGDPKANTTVANRYGQNQQLASAVAQADNAISYLALAFVDTDGLSPVALEWEGTTYKYQDDQNGLDSKKYPLSRDLHCYTWDGTSKQEAAVINMVLHDFGQDTFVGPNNYFKLGARRQKEQKDKLPSQS
ncbi:PstS family phosphate ABC transporter substrate-binding protein [Halorientalis pallida]|uniref:PstS family phosphate ABC transporter substrate-binding protein n=1 Tax=Halorientalis pallida TaxID=2479928 RepID=UPI003C700AEB